MSITFENYWPLGLLLLIPYLWWFRSHSLAGLQPKHLVLLTSVRSTIVICLTIALMQPTLHPSGTWTSLVYGVDFSQSVSPTAQEEALLWIEKANREGSPDHWGIVAFGNNPVGLNTENAFERLRTEDLQLLNTLDPSGTDLEAAMDQGRSSFKENHLKRLVLFTDGNVTTGNLSSAISRLRRDGVRVYTVPMSSRTIGDAWIETVNAPTLVTAEEPFELEVQLYSQVDRAGLLELTDAEKILARQPVQLTAGTNYVSLKTTLNTAQETTLQAKLLIDDDPVQINNSFRESVQVIERPRVLYVEGRPDSAKHLRQALESGGLSVEIASPRNLANSTELLETYSAIILSDVNRNELTQSQMDAIASYVSERSGGFILAGGEAVFGDDGYSETPIEKILPVTFTIKEKPRDVAIIIVLDKSWSMAGTKIELSKEASKAAVDVLEDQHRIGVVSFNNDLDWPVRLQPASNREWIKNRIGSIVPSGYTNIYPALEAAFRELIDVEVRVKHIILLSDGRTYPAEYERLVGEMVEEKMTISTIAVGAEADRVLLGNIANWGAGRAYVVDDAAEVPQIFTEETERATRPNLMEEPFNLLVRKQVEMFTGIDFNAAPPLKGYTSTQIKDTAEELLLSDEGSPILARWHYGLGQTAAFTSDVKDRWAADWLEWNGYGKFWTQLVRETMRRQEDERADAFRAYRQGKNAYITINRIAPDGTFENMLAPRIAVTDPAGRTISIETNQVGPGKYEAILPVTERGDYLFRALGSSLDSSRALVYSYPKEYQFYPPRLELLQTISQATGGDFNPTVEDLFLDKNETTVLAKQLWPYLVTLALILFFVDILLRRVRLFEPT